MATPSGIRVGTASWSDPEFVRDWYPKSLKPYERLAWYAQRFGLVEVNSTFYFLPSASVIQKWIKQTPDDFVFDIKLFKLLSRHSTKADELPRDLRDQVEVRRGRVVLTPALEEEVLKRVLQATSPLKESGKLGAFLLQLTPSFAPESHRLTELDHLLRMLHGYNVAVELRNRHWVSDEQLEKTLHYFVRKQVALVSLDVPESDNFMVMPSGAVVTTPKLGYLRAHGRNAEGFVHGRSPAERFNYDYSIDELREIADRVQEMRKEAQEIHVIFNNNKSNFAPKAAAAFMDILHLGAGKKRERGQLTPRKKKAPVESPQTVMKL